MNTNDTQQPYGARKRMTNSRRIRTGATMLAFGSITLACGRAVDYFYGLTIAGLYVGHGLVAIGGALVIWGGYRWFVGVSNIADYTARSVGAAAEYHEAE